MSWGIRQRRPSRRPVAQGREARPTVEPLEPRRVLTTVTPALAVAPALTAATSASVTNATPPAGALSPAGLSQLYGVSLSSGSGAGEVISIVDAYNDPNVRQDLATFDARYGLPAAKLTVVNQNGGTALPATDPGWSLEIALDVEWAHASAPGASIVLVEASSTNLTDMIQAVKTASGLSNVVSMSWGSSEFNGQQWYDALFNKSYVTYVAASGDDGGASGAEWPASSPYVLSVGGTAVTASGETAWSASSSGYAGYSGSAGGTSGISPLPAYQSSALGADYASGRSVPDVASVADPSTGLAVYDSVPGNGSTGWSEVGGTSAGAPVWAGTVAAADQARAATGRKSLGSLDTLNLLYGLSESNGSTSAGYAALFHDVTSGANYAGSAGPGYDQVTGLGSPVAGTIVAVSARYGPTWAQIVASSVHASATTAVATATSPSVALTTRAAVSPATAAAGSTPTSPAFVVLTPTVDGTTRAALAPSASPTSSVSNLTPATSSASRPVQALPRPVAVSLLPSPDPVGEVVRPAAPEAPDTPGIFFDPVELPRIGEAGPLLAGRPSPSGPLWDAALDLIFIETVPASEAEAEPLDPGKADASPSAATVAGLAVAIWGTWEYRSRRPERDRRYKFFAKVRKESV